MAEQARQQDGHRGGRCLLGTLRLVLVLFLTMFSPLGSLLPRWTPLPGAEEAPADTGCGAAWLWGEAGGGEPRSSAAPGGLDAAPPPPQGAEGSGRAALCLVLAPGACT